MGGYIVNQYGAFLRYMREGIKVFPSDIEYQVRWRVVVALAMCVLGK